MNNWERMKAGRLYNADSKDLEKYHSFGMETCDKFNRTPLWMKKRKQRLLEKMIPSGSSPMSVCRSSIRTVSMTLSMQNRSTSEAEAGSVRVQQSVAE